ncbi:MAG: putative two-component system sensor kinase [Frankiales bacterium]|nr:putative two-component system sensor kinase [Frankiales bacterium]
MTAVAAWLITPCALVVVVLLDQKLRAVGREDLTLLHADSLAFPAASLSAATVGAALVVNDPRHPVGWLFLALGDLVAFDGVLSAYGAFGAVARPGALPGATVVSVVADNDFIWWIVLLALILHLSPTGRPLSRLWGAAASATVACGLVWFAAGVLHPGHLHAPLQTVSNPLRPGALGDALASLGPVPGYATGLGLLCAAASLIVRFRRAEGMARQRLLWMAVAAALVPGFVAVTFVTSQVGSDLGTSIASGVFVSVLPVTAGLSVSRYHLYDVDRILTRAVTYLLISALLATTYLAAIVILGQVFGDVAGRSQFADVAATLAAVAVAGPSYRSIQNTVDRRFNRRKFEALRQVRDFVRDPPPDRGLRDLLRAALEDPKIDIAYWIESRHTWVTADGQAAVSGSDDVVVHRQGRPVASIRFDPAVCERWLVAEAAHEAAGELDNGGLRADLALRLVEVQQSRARLAAAQVTERRKIERDLHDGAQQRLLAVALQLRAAHDGTDPARLWQVAESSIQQIQAAIAELRELANGVHPAVLTTGGLVAALDELATRTPLPVLLNVPDDRFTAEVEATAWFIACEAVVNAVKHGSPTTITINVTRQSEHVVLDIIDNGSGVADPNGRGLRGIADRAESIGGTLVLHSDDRGTSVRAELPCAS